MKHLWTPWRKEYIEKHRKDEACVFCRAQAEDDGPGNLIVSRGEHAYVILNRYPYTSGHAMIVPYVHESNLDRLTPAIRSEMMELTSRCITVLREIYTPEGFNLGANMGSAAGAGVKDHVHLHVVPRWIGDTNFMSTVGETRVLPETLESTYSRLHAAFQNRK
ncbi:MAG TPA: HIT domain-containing protein [Anaerolineales bacterium]